jgi:hypothetical protein
VEIPQDLSVGLVVDRIPPALSAGLAADRIHRDLSVALADDATASDCCASRNSESGVSNRSAKHAQQNAYRGHLFEPDDDLRNLTKAALAG